MAINYAFLGPNGSGKSTQGKLLRTKYKNVNFISAGDLLRREVELETPFGLEYKKDLALGKFAPTSVVNELMMKEVQNSRHEINILDGFPRNVEQLELSKGIIHIDKCISFIFTDIDEIVSRSVARGRSDDTESVVLERLETFHKVTLPVLDHYKFEGKLIEFDASGTEYEVNERIIKILEL